MRILFDPALVQELVSAESLQDLAFRELLRSRMDPVYELPLEKRAEGFARVHADLFAEQGWGAVVAEEIARFPVLARLEGVRVFRAERPGEEGAELSRDRRSAGIRLTVGRLCRPQELRPFLHHELMHICDMLDDSFGYQSQALGETPAEEQLYRQCYQLLWDIYVDGRLERRGLEAGAKRDERLIDWERAFSFLPRRARRQGFQCLWQGEGLTHSHLVAWARDPSSLVGEGSGRETAVAPIPGAPCPLCRFPSYAWGDIVPVAKLIQADFPSWEPEEGACQRCVELYQLRAGVW